MRKSANPVLIKRYEVVGNKVLEVGQKIYLPVEFVRYAEPPPVLEQCGECANAIRTEFAPEGCGDLRNMRSAELACADGNDIWEGGSCDGFTPGTPRIRANPLRIVP